MVSSGKICLDKDAALAAVMAHLSLLYFAQQASDSATTATCELLQVHPGCRRFPT